MPAAAPSAFRPEDHRLQQTLQDWLQIAMPQRCLHGLSLSRLLLAAAAALEAGPRRTVNILCPRSGSTIPQLVGLQKWRVLHCS